MGLQQLVHSAQELPHENDKPNSSARASLCDHCETLPVYAAKLDTAITCANLDVNSRALKRKSVESHTECLPWLAPAMAVV
eukprot:6126621-Amphidinium_carterae.2